MKHRRYGFTLVEIALFLAISGILFIGIMAGTQNSIRTQRYNDSVQSFANFWRDIYASVSNTQNPQGNSGGRSEDAIYGKLVVFGQEYDLNGSNADSWENQYHKIFYYDVVGSAIVPAAASESNDVLAALSSVGANVIQYETNNTTHKDELSFSGFADSYTPTWGAIIDQKGGTATRTELFTGSILVVKHPRSTAISTYYTPTILPINEQFKNQNGADGKKAKEIFGNALKNKSFVKGDIDMCVNSSDIGNNWQRMQNVRLVENANNISGVEVIAAGSDGNRCAQ